MGSLVVVKVGGRHWALSGDAGSRRPPEVSSVDLNTSGGSLEGDGGASALRLLAGSQSAHVLDGDAFVGVAADLPPAQLRACLENCLLECTSTRAVRGDESSGFSSSKLNVGLAALVQQAALAAGPGAGVAPSYPGPQLFPPDAGLPPLGALLRRAVLPPSATARLISAPAAQLFAAHSPAGAGRRSAMEHFDIGSVPSLFSRGRSHVRAAARRGSRYYTLLSGVPLWQWFDTEPSVASCGDTEATCAAAANGKPSQSEQAAAGAGSGGKAKQARRGQQTQQKRKRGAASTSPACTQLGAPAAPAPCTLCCSACACSSPDLGVLWCTHRVDGMAALLADPALHVLDCDALGALLAPLSARQLAMLLLTVALASGTLPDVLLSLQLAPGTQAGLFLPRLGPLALPVPLTADLRNCCYSPADAALASYQAAGMDPYSYTGPPRDGANTTANPLQPPHAATRLSVLSPVQGSVLRAVDARVTPLPPELVWHLKAMGVDALDAFPEALGQPNAAGIWPIEVRGGVSLAFEDALGLVRALSALGGGYSRVALQLLKDVTVTAAHPAYFAVSLSVGSRPSLARRLAQLWQQLTTAEERWHLFMDGGMRLPAVWSECVVEVAWQVVGHFPVLWSLGRHLHAAARGTSRTAAMALLTRGTSLLPRSAAGAGASAFTDLLLFERGMQRGFAQHVEGLAAFLKQKEGQLRPARAGSLLQRASRSVAQQLLSDQPLAQSHAAFQELILDLQEAVLAEAAALLRDAAFSDVPAPGAAEAEPPLGTAAVPGMLRSAGGVLRSHTVGVLSNGLVHNAEGLDRHALPPHLPPPLASMPFNWVTLDVSAMLAQPPTLSAAACWAAAYLHLAPKYSPAGAVPLWAWLRQGGVLGQLLGCAVGAAARKDWHVAAMLADSAYKYLQSAESLAPAASTAELAQLQAARTLLRTLATSAAAQLRAFLELLGPPDEPGAGAPGSAAAVLTHTSSLRACCLLLRAVVTLMAEAVEPLLLRPGGQGGGGAAGALPPHVMQMLELQDMQAVLDLHQQALEQAQQALLAAQEQVVVAAQHADHAQQAIQAVAQEQAMIDAVNVVQAAAGVAGGVQVAAGLAQEQPAPVLAAAAAAVAAGEALPAALPPAVAEALAADASALLQVANIAMELAHATLCAPPLLPLASSMPSVAAGSTRQRQQQDTALWRAAELSSDFDQYPYHHDAGDDGPQSRCFALNDVLLLLGQALPAALLPLLGRPAAQQVELPEGSEAGAAQLQQGPRQTRQQQARQQQAQQQQQQGRRPQHEGVQGPRAGDAAGLEANLLSMVPLTMRLAGRLVETMEESSGRGSSSSSVARLKHSASLSLVCCLMHLASRVSGGTGAAQLAASPAAWKLLSSYMLDIMVMASNRPNGGGALRLTWLAPPTLLRMLRACTVVPAPPAATAQQVDAALSGGSKSGQKEQARGAQEQLPAAKRRRRSTRHSSAAPEGEEAGTPAAAADGAARLQAAGPSPVHSSAAAALVAHAADENTGAERGGGGLWVGDVRVDPSMAQTAVSRTLTWLTAGAQENWRGSNYTLWRPRPAAPLAGAAAAAPPQAGQAAPAAPQGGQQAQQAGQVQQGVPAADAAMAAIAAEAAAVANPGEQLQALHDGIQQAQAQVAAMAAAVGGPGALPPHIAAQMAGQRPRRAFAPRQVCGAVAAAFSKHWPLAAIQVVHWWVQHRGELQPPEVRSGRTALSAADDAPCTGGAPAKEARDRRHEVFQMLGMADGGGGTGPRLDSREESFATLDGPVRLASATRAAPKLRMLGGTLLTLLCMECAPEVSSAAASALLDAARQPGAAADLADTAPFWVLQRLLVRGDGEAGPPAEVLARGREVVQAVEAALLAESGEWAAVLASQAAASKDAEALAVERRAAAGAAAAGVANPLLPPPPPWFVNAHLNAMMDPLMVGGVPLMAAPGFDDDGFNDDEGEDFDEDDEEEDEGMGDSDLEDDFEGELGGPWPFF